MPTVRQTPRLAVCVATIGRDPGLRRLLVSLSRQRFVDDVVVVVVDNTAKGDLSRVELQPVLAPLALDLVHEATPGIPAARNRSVERALSLGAELIAFVDDDEVVPEDWLETLVAEIEALGADVVAAPVRGLLPPGAPTWLEDAQPFRPADRIRGERMRTCATHNTLVRARLFQTVQPWFLERFTASGGSDAEFFARAGRRGATIVWTDRAAATECVEAARASAWWVLRRGVRVGALEVTLAGRWRGVPRGVLRVARGFLEAGVSLTRPGRHGMGAALSRVAEGFGNLAGAAGYLPRGYEAPSP